MGLYRDESGLVFEADDRFASSMGYEPVTPVEEADIYAQRGLEARGEERGALGAAWAGASRFASGATLGLSDVALGQFMTDAEREQTQREIEAHPYISAGAEMAGAIGTGIAAPGSFLAKTPSGYLSRLAEGQVEKGLARGGLGGYGRAMTAMGAEGAVQSAGQYVGHAALADKDVTAEGLAGALGTGYTFGALGGGAALGVVKGTVAARRLFARTMDGQGAAKAAESSWKLAHQEALDAAEANLSTAQRQADDINAAKMEALRYRNEARADVRERATRVTAEAGPSSAVPDEGFVGPEPLDAGIGPAKGGAITHARGVPVETPTATAAVPETALEAQLAGTKAKLDEGAALKDIGDKYGEAAVPGSPVSPQVPPGKPPPTQPGRGPRNSINDWLSELADYQDISKPLSAHAVGRAADTLGEIRQARTADLLGPTLAKQEAKLIEALDEQKAALEEFRGLAGFGDISTGVPIARGKGGLSAAEDAAALLPPGVKPRAPDTGSPKARRALEILDDAHEEALLVARSSEDPREVGAALQRADDAETLMERLSAPVSTGVPEFIDDMGSASRVFDRLEKANAKVVDALGDAAHPASVARAKAWKQAEDEAVRKMTDRTARAVDDAEYGPRTPKQNLVDAQRGLDEVSVQDQEARRALGKAEKEAKAQRKARKDAERLDAKAAKATSGVAEGLGAIELLDLPGMPKLSDLPVVGPLLGAYLKYRTISAALGRKMGRVPASADNRVAALASRTRDRVAKAVDRSLGAVETGGRAVAKHAPKVAGILSSRIFDDGEPDVKKGASVPEQAATRIRELANYVTTPGAIERDVRRELVGVTDPDIIDAAEKHRRAMMEYLLSKAPKAPEQGMMRTIRWAPSPAQAMSFARRLQAASDPAGALERLAAQNDIASVEIGETLRAVYPQILAQAQGRLLERLTNEPTNIPYRMRLQLSMLYQLPLDSALDPANLQISQSVYERKPSSPAYNPGAPGAAPPPAPTVQPAIANPVDISRAYTPTLDRR